MHLLLAYIKFLFRSTNEHGVHSPFVFGLVTKCFYDKSYYPAYNLIREYRQKLLKSKDSIKITDYGAGSRIFSSEERKISAIARNAGISPKRARLLNRLVDYLQVETALELGTSVGLGTVALTAGNNVKVTSIEGCPETAAVAREQFEKFGLDNIELIVGEFEAVLKDRGFKTEQKVESGEWREEIGSTRLEVKNGQRTKDNGQSIGSVESEEWKEEREQVKKSSKVQIPNSRIQNRRYQSIPPSQQTMDNRQPTTDRGNSEIQIPNSSTCSQEPKPELTTDNPLQTTHNSQPANQQTAFDLLFIDGNHRKEPTLQYFEELLPLVHNDSVMIFDDIHWSKEMEEAWEEIKKHSSVKVTIDTFFQGFVFFRREQAKEHFVIRLS